MYDLISILGISKSVIQKSVDIVMEIICKCDALKIVFPTSHTAQLDIAKVFEKNSVRSSKHV